MNRDRLLSFLNKHTEEDYKPPPASTTASPGDVLKLNCRARGFRGFLLSPQAVNFDSWIVQFPDDKTLNWPGELNAEFTRKGDGAYLKWLVANPRALKSAEFLLKNDEEGVALGWINSLFDVRNAQVYGEKHLLGVGPDDELEAVGEAAKKYGGGDRKRELEFLAQAFTAETLLQCPFYEIMHTIHHYAPSAPTPPEMSDSVRDVMGSIIGGLEVPKVVKAMVEQRHAFLASAQITQSQRPQNRLVNWFNENSEPSEDWAVVEATQHMDAAHLMDVSARKHGFNGVILNNTCPQAVTLNWTNQISHGMMPPGDLEDQLIQRGSDHYFRWLFVNPSMLVPLDLIQAIDRTVLAQDGVTGLAAENAAFLFGESHDEAIQPGGYWNATQEAYEKLSDGDHDLMLQLIAKKNLLTEFTGGGAERILDLVVAARPGTFDEAKIPPTEAASLLNFLSQGDVDAINGYVKDFGNAFLANTELPDLD